MIAAMGLKDRIQEDMKAAMRARQSERLGTIRLLLAALKQREVDERVELDDQAIVGIVDKLIKQRKDSIAAFEPAGATLRAGGGAAFLALAGFAAVFLPGIRRSFGLYGRRPRNARLYRPNPRCTVNHTGQYEPLFGGETGVEKRRPVATPERRGAPTDGPAESPGRLWTAALASASVKRAARPAAASSLAGDAWRLPSCRFRRGH